MWKPDMAERVALLNLRLTDGVLQLSIKICLLPLQWRRGVTSRAKFECAPERRFSIDGQDVMLREDARIKKLSAVK